MVTFWRRFGEMSLGSDRTGAISKCGDEMMRIMLYEAAQTEHISLFGFVAIMP
jgi:hypothetical protein